MNTVLLLELLAQYGADIHGIQERFLGDMDFYADCFTQFLEDETFQALGTELKAGDPQAAFQAAHCLKGLTGNMGLTPAYTLVCQLTEILRAQSLDHSLPLYMEILAQRQALQDIAARTR